MIRFALIAASVLGFARTAALGNLMVPLSVVRFMHVFLSKSKLSALI